VTGRRTAQEIYGDKHISDRILYATRDLNAQAR